MFLVGTDEGWLSDTGCAGKIVCMALSCDCFMWEQLISTFSLPFLSSVVTFQTPSHDGADYDEDPKVFGSFIGA
jgi:hypothetical protein